MIGTRERAGDCATCWTGEKQKWENAIAGVLFGPSTESRMYARDRNAEDRRGRTRMWMAVKNQSLPSEKKPKKFVLDKYLNVDGRKVAVTTYDNLI